MISCKLKTVIILCLEMLVFCVMFDCIPECQVNGLQNDTNRTKNHLLMDHIRCYLCEEP